MRNFFLIVLLCAAIFSIDLLAQNGPAPSPAAKTTQTIGTTDVTVAYSRPSMKGRKIFGELVPFDAVWRTGANSATKISFSKDVKVEGQALAAGDYALFTTPGKESWKIHFHKFDQPGAGAYGKSTPALTVEVKPVMASEKMESFMIMFDNLKDTSGEMGLMWDNVYVPIQLGVM